MNTFFEAFLPNLELRYHLNQPGCLEKHYIYQIHFEKLKRNLPEGCAPIIDQADYFDDEKLQYLRKRTLDIGNETIRNIEGELDNYTIEFTFK